MLAGECYCLTVALDDVLIRSVSVCAWYWLGVRNAWSAWFSVRSAYQNVRVVDFCGAWSGPLRLVDSAL